mgnify:CR=1 FL=1
MGLLNIGASGLLASQTAINTTGHNIANEAKAETIKPLYKAPITFLLLPNFTKKVPIIDVKIQAPPIVKG